MKLVFICMVFSCVFVGYGQDMEYGTADTNTVMQLLKNANLYNFYKADSGLVLSEKALGIARRLHFKKGEAKALHICGESFNMLGDFPQALKFQFGALAMAKEMNDKAAEAEALNYIGNVYIQLGEYREALQYFIPSKTISGEADDITEVTFALANIGDVYDFLQMPDSALYYQKAAYAYFPRLSRTHLKTFVLRHMGSIYEEFGQHDSAVKFYHAAIANSRLSNDNINMSMNQKKMAEVYKSVHQYDSSRYYAHESFVNAQKANAKSQVFDASTLLASLYRSEKNTDSAFLYMDIASAIKDSLYGSEKFRQLQLLMLNQQQSEQAARQDEEQFRNKIKYAALLTTLGIFLLLAFILIRNNRAKQHANNLLKAQKDKIEKSMTELKAAQAQLVQREKMASLGELTAGIAHEIQNPLNFVNNFSDVNTELLQEASEEMDKGNISDAKQIINDIKQNEKKINHHGKRADAIVKGMLQHSQTNTGAKELTDINALADEYLRIAYHGLSAKEKSFHAILNTDYDETMGRVSIIPQDIGRVLLNLYNNAFYTVNEKMNASSDLANSYEPTVFVHTKKTGDKILVSVKDNGNGIPQKDVDKIFQPFFTTKPTGQGTGLGLSLSYDIIKAHGGEIKVNTNEGKFTEFVVQLPV